MIKGIVTYTLRQYHHYTASLWTAAKEPTAITLKITESSDWEVRLRFHHLELHSKFISKSFIVEENSNENSEAFHWRI